MTKANTEPTPRELIKAAFAKWIPRLGLAWWDIDVIYLDDPAEIVRTFAHDDDGVDAMLVNSDWRYGKSRIRVNLLAHVGMSADEMERNVVHELCHILVNEMREGELHHEERVVTGLTKAFFWVEAAVLDEKEAKQP